MKFLKELREYLSNMNSDLDRWYKERNNDIASYIEIEDVSFDGMDDFVDVQVSVRYGRYNPEGSGHNWTNKFKMMLANEDLKVDILKGLVLMDEMRSDCNDE